MANLITLDEYKAAKGIVKTDQDPILENLITNVSGIIQRYLQRSFVNEGVIEEIFTVDYDTPYIYLDNYPIFEVVSVTTIDPESHDSSVYYAYDEDLYTVDLAKGKLTSFNKCGWPQGLESVKVSYRLVEENEEVVIPPALKQATIDLVTYYHKEQWRDSQQLMGASINNQTGAGNRNIPDKSFPPHIQRVLDLFK